MWCVSIWSTVQSLQQSQIWLRIIRFRSYFLNRELVTEDLERWSELYYVGADASQSGVLEGEIAADAFKKNCRY